MILFQVGLEQDGPVWYNLGAVKLTMAYGSDSDPGSQESTRVASRPIVGGVVRILPAFSSEAQFHLAPVPDDHVEEPRVITPVIPADTSLLSRGFSRRIPS